MHLSGGGGNAGNVHVIANPAGNEAGGGNFPGPPLPVAPVVAAQDIKLIVEAPPVTELVTETPLENGLSTSALGVIGGKEAYSSLAWARDDIFLVDDKRYPAFVYTKASAAVWSQERYIVNMYLFN